MPVARSIFTTAAAAITAAAFLSGQPPSLHRRHLRADGHVNNRIVRFTKDGRFVKAWGKRGTGPGEFNVPHTLAFDSQGRLFVGDRGNRRLQVFDQDGTLLDQWAQFGRPSGMLITADDTLYVADVSEPGGGLTIGSARTGVVREKIVARFPRAWRSTATAGYTPA